MHESFFNELAIKLPQGINAKELVQKLADQNIIAGYPANEDTLLITATEIATDSGIEAITEAIKGAL